MIQLFIRNNAKLIKVIIIIFITGFIMFNGIKVLLHYIRLDKDVYKSIEEIIDTKYKDKDVEYFGENGYYYLISGEHAESQQLIWQKDVTEFIYVNEYHKETQSARMIFDTIMKNDLYAFVQVYTHNEKYIMLISPLVAYQPVKIFDSYGELKSIRISEEQFYFSVIDKTSIVNNYILNIQYGDEIVYTATTDDFVYKGSYEK